MQIPADRRRGSFGNLHSSAPSQNNPSPFAFIRMHSRFVLAPSAPDPRWGCLCLWPLPGVAPPRRNPGLYGRIPLGFPEGDFPMPTRLPIDGCQNDKRSRSDEALLHPHPFAVRPRRVGSGPPQGVQAINRPAFPPEPHQRTPVSPNPVPLSQSVGPTSHLPPRRRHHQVMMDRHQGLRQTGLVPMPKWIVPDCTLVL